MKVMMSSASAIASGNCCTISPVHRVRANGAVFLLPGRQGRRRCGSCARRTLGWTGLSTGLVSQLREDVESSIQISRDLRQNFRDILGRKAHACQKLQLTWLAALPRRCSSSVRASSSTALGEPSGSIGIKEEGDGLMWVVPTMFEQGLRIISGEAASFLNLHDGFFSCHVEVKPERGHSWTWAAAQTASGSCQGPIWISKKSEQETSLQNELNESTRAKSLWMRTTVEQNKHAGNYAKQANRRVRLLLL
mmetsp:Transcript_49566/g.105473  ORF Transcript_49566/g.105473 Transcript_49566/m.105473 type:complete len:250 (-) Transcript_49566:38-787(-)